MTLSTLPRLALIEDNADLCAELTDYLRAQGYVIWSANSAEHFWRTLHGNPVDLVLVDLNLPGEDGFGVVRYLRQLGEFGLIILTARDNPADRRHGLSLGADLYLVKPVNFARLCQEIQALWQRQQSEAAARLLPAASAACQLGATGWQLDRLASTLMPPGADVKLPITPQELLLLEHLLHHAGGVCSKQELHEAIFGPDPAADLHRVEVILSRLRQKALNAGIRLPIRTLFGRGLVFQQTTRPRS